MLSEWTKSFIRNTEHIQTSGPTGGCPRPLPPPRVLYLPTQVRVGTQLFQSRGRGFQSRKKGLQGQRAPAKNQRWGWDLGDLPGLLHLFNKLIEHLSSTCPLAGFVSGTEVSGEKTHLSCPPDLAGCCLSQDNTGWHLLVPGPALDLTRPCYCHRYSDL